MKKLERIFTLVLFMVTFTVNAYSQVWAEISSFHDKESYLGSDLAIDSEYGVAGALKYNDNQGYVAVMKFNSSDSIWQKIATLTASDGTSGDEFGVSVAIDGDYIVVGASGDVEGSGVGHGAAYVFKKPFSGWTDMTETAKLTASSYDDHDIFGHDVAIEGETIVIGAPGDWKEGSSSAGYVHIFVRPTTGWESTSSTIKLTASDGASGHFFGNDVAISNETIIVGASKVNDKGAVYVFEKPKGGWTTSQETAKLTSTYTQTDPPLNFGASVDIQDDIIVAGAPTYGFVKGRAFIFKKPVTGWENMTQSAYLRASDESKYSIFGETNFFGGDVNIDGDTIAIGSQRFGEYGAVYLFYKPATGWSSGNESEMVEVRRKPLFIFGYPLDISKNTFLTGIGPQFFTPQFFDPIEWIVQPPDSLMACVNSQVNLVVSANNAKDYFWQISTDNGISFEDVSRDELHDSVSTDTLLINMNQYLKGFQYRCIVYNPQYMDTSNTVTLILDDEAPTIITQPTDQLLYAGTDCQAELPGYHDEVDVTDNCSVDTIIQTPPAGTLVDGDINLITLSVRDERGNETTVDFNVSVVDTTRPDLQPNDVNLNVYANDDCVGILPDYGSILQATDNCDDTLDVVQSPETGSSISDSSIVNLTFTDDAGNSIDTSFWVHVEDTLSPVILSEHDDVILPGRDECSATLPDYTGDVMVRENCSASVGVVQSPAPGTTVSGAFNVITLAISDESGNTTEVTFEASVEDTLVPSITCASDTTIDLEEGESVYVVPGTQLDPRGVGDNCGFTMVSNDFQTGLTLEDAEIPVGTHVITWTVQDASGNRNTCTMKVEVRQPLGLNVLTSLGCDIYPNPAADEIYIIDTQDIVDKVEVYDVSGRKVLSKNKHVENKILNVSHLTSGIYFLNIYVKDNILTVKIIKE